MATYAGRKRAAPSCYDQSPLKPIANHVPRSDAETRPVKKARLTQAVLDFGQRPPKPCPNCSMPYRSYDPQEVKLHRKYCKALSAKAGIEVPRSFFDGTQKVNTSLWRQRSSSKKKPTSFHDRQQIVVVEVSRQDAEAAKRIAEKTLRAAEDELGAVKTTKDELWSTCTLHCGAPSKRPATQTQSETGGSQGSSSLASSRTRHYDRYKSFLAMVGNQCIGICLAERIVRAYKVLPTKVSPDECFVSASNDASHATMGVSRIWVTKEFRRSLVASDLLETARTHFLHGTTVDIAEIAFSQPTRSGANFAREWFGLEDGWLVYT